MMLSRLKRLTAVSLFAVSVPILAADARPADTAAAPAVAVVAATPRLYTLDCGRIDVADMASFSDTGDLDGKPGHIVDPCYVIVHPKGILVWDTGMGDALAAQKGGVDNGGFHIVVATTMVDQLAAIGMTPADVTYLAFSHTHFDHTGNAGLFTSSTWILNKTEFAWALGTPTPEAVNAPTLAAAKTVKTEMIDGDHDVFGDGSVRILLAPGHSPGHCVLMLELKKAGTVILSGDLYHTLENVKLHRVPTFNTSRAETMASFDRIDKIVKRTHARFVVQHAPEDFAKMPKFPAYLD